MGDPNLDKFPPESGNDACFDDAVAGDNCYIPGSAAIDGTFTVSVSGSFDSMLAHYEQGFYTPLRQSNSNDWLYTKHEWEIYSQVNKRLIEGVIWNDVIKRFDPGVKVADSQFDDDASVAFYEFNYDPPIFCDNNIFDVEISSNSSSSTSSTSSVSSSSSSSVSSVSI